MSANNETHISVLKVTHDKLKEIAKYEQRTLRTVVTKLIDDKHAKVIK